MGIYSCVDVEKRTLLTTTSGRVNRVDRPDGYAAPIAVSRHARISESTDVRPGLPWVMTILGCFVSYEAQAASHAASQQRLLV